MSDITPLVLRYNVFRITSFSNLAKCITSRSGYLVGGKQGICWREMGGVADVWLESSATSTVETLMPSLYNVHNIVFSNRWSDK